MKVSQLMASRVVVARPHHTLGQARDLLATHGIQALPVVDDAGRPLGILTASDLVADFPATTAVAELMTSGIHSVPPDCDARQAARQMRRLRIHHLAVCDGDRLAGILSAFDLLRLLEPAEG